MQTLTLASTHAGVNTKTDPSGTLSDGTEIKTAIEFKAWLVDHIDVFSECVAKKLLTHATGRVPNYAERKELANIVRANCESEGGFRDLVLALIESKSFRTRW